MKAKSGLSVLCVGLAMAACLVVAQAGELVSILWSYHYLETPLSTSGGKLWKISGVTDKADPRRISLTCEYVGEGIPKPARITILLGDSQGKTVVQDFANEDLFKKPKVQMACRLDVPKGSRLFLAQPAPEDSHKGPIVCTSNIIDL